MYTGVSYDQVLPMKNGMYGYDCQTKTITEYVKDGDMHIGLFWRCGEGRDLKMFFAGSTMDKYGSGQYPDLYVWENGKAALFAKARQFRGLCSHWGYIPGRRKKIPGEGRSSVFYLLRPAPGDQCFLQRTAVFPRQWILTAPWTASARWRAVSPWWEERPESSRRSTSMILPPIHTAQISDLNGAALKDRYVGELHPAGFTDSDGVDIDGWVILPKDYDPSKKYPAILDMHGGPRVAFGNTMFHEMQVFANNGYFVMLCNPRGRQTAAATSSRI